LKIEKRLEELNIRLPKKVLTIANYEPFSKTGNLVFISGQGPIIDGENKYPGKLGRELTKEQGYKSARISGLNVLAALKAAVGDLDKITRIVSIKGFVNSTEDFYDQAYVINGVSDLVKEVFQQKGNHSRCAVSVISLLMNVSIELELIAEFKND